MNLRFRADHTMVEVYLVFVTAVYAITALVALLVSYRAYKGYRIAGNLNLLFLSAGFALIALVFGVDTAGVLAAQRHAAAPGVVFLLTYTLTMVEVVAYLLILLAYFVKPKAEDVLPIVPIMFLPFTFQIFIAILLAVIVFSVWAGYRRRPTASTALVLSSFSLLFILHFINALLTFSPRIQTAGYLYFSLIQLLAFVLLYMAIGPRQDAREQRERRNIE